MIAHLLYFYLTKNAIIIQQDKQNIYPFSNSVVIRSKRKSAKNYSLGSGVIITINETKYIATVGHNLYKNPQQFQVIVFVKQQKLLNQGRIKIQIKKQNLNFNQNFFLNQESRHQIAFIEIQNQNLIKNNREIKIQLDWKYASNEKVYFMAFPYDFNYEKIEMSNIEISAQLIKLLFREIEVKKQDNQFLYYKNPTQEGESGGALIIQRNDQFYLIGLHIGAHEQIQKIQNKQKKEGYNFGILFTSQLKSIFPNIFLKRIESNNLNEEQSQSIERLQQKIKKNRMEQDDYKRNRPTNDSDEQNQSIQRKNKMRFEQGDHGSRNITYMPFFQQFKKVVIQGYNLYQFWKQRQNNDRVFDTSKSCADKTNFYICRDQYQSGDRFGKCGFKMDNQDRIFWCPDCLFKNSNN